MQWTSLSSVTNGVDLVCTFLALLFLGGYSLKTDQAKDIHVHITMHVFSTVACRIFNASVISNSKHRTCLLPPNVFSQKPAIMLVQYNKPC